MPRPVRCRRIRFTPDNRLFKPAGVPARCLEEILLSMDELEALRLVDLVGQYQEEASQSMGVSRPTLSRILAEGRRKVTDALVTGKVLRIDGGEVRLEERAAHRADDGAVEGSGRRFRRRCLRSGVRGGTDPAGSPRNEGEDNQGLNEQTDEEVVEES